MTFEQWQGTRREVASIAETLGTTCDEGPGFVYAGGAFIELNDVETFPAGKYALTIENYTTCGDDIETLERELWERWAKTEVQ